MNFDDLSENLYVFNEDERMWQFFFLDLSRCGLCSSAFGLGMVHNHQNSRKTRLTAAELKEKKTKTQTKMRRRLMMMMMMMMYDDDDH